MKKQYIVRLGLFALLCFLVSCSNLFQPSTKLGQPIVNDVDPNLVDINRNIKPFSDSLASTPMSMVDLLDTFPPGYQWNPPYIAAGRNAGLDGKTHEDVIAYLEFRPLGFRKDASVFTSLKAAIIDSVVFNVRRMRVTTRSTPDAAIPAIINVDTCSVVLGTSSIKGHITDTIPFTLDSLKNAKYLGFFSVPADSAGGDTALSIKLDSGIYVTKIKNLMKDTPGPSDTAAFAFCLAANDSSQGLGRFMNINGDGGSPRLVVYYHASMTDTSLRTQTMYRDHATYTSIESDPSIASGSSISSWENIRRAVYNIDVSSLAAFMDTAGPDSLKYVVVQKADVRVPISKSISDMRLDSIQIYYKLLDTVATSQNSFSNYGQFWIRDSIARDTSYVIPLAGMLQPLIINHHSKSVNLYLSIRGQNSPTGYGPPFIQVAWKPDSKLKLNAIVTNPR